MLVEPGGGRGDCFRCCVAALMDFPPIAVPHFFEQGDVLQGWADLDQYLSSYGLAWAEMTFPDMPVAALLDGLREGHQLRNTYAMLLGRGATDNHAVVILNGEVVCDPSWSNLGISGPASNGVYTVGLIVPSTMKSE